MPTSEYERIDVSYDAYQAFEGGHSCFVRFPKRPVSLNQRYMIGFSSQPGILGRVINVQKEPLGDGGIIPVAIIIQDRYVLMLKPKEPATAA